jgi:hypothetical protein
MHRSGIHKNSVVQSKLRRNCCEFRHKLRAGEALTESYTTPPNNATTDPASVGR